MLSDDAALEALGLRHCASALVLCTEGATDPVAYEEIVGHAPAGLR